MGTEVEDFKTAQQHFNDACAEVMETLVHVNPFFVAEKVFAMPSDLAAHGFDVNLRQSDTKGWWIDIEYPIGDDVFSVSGNGTSLVEAFLDLVVCAREVFTFLGSQLGIALPEAA